MRSVRLPCLVADRLDRSLAVRESRSTHSPRTSAPHTGGPCVTTDSALPCGSLLRRTDARSYGIDPGGGTDRCHTFILFALVDSVDRLDEERDGDAQEGDKNDAWDSTRRPEAGY